MSTSARVCGALTPAIVTEKTSGSTLAILTAGVFSGLSPSLAARHGVVYICAAEARGPGLIRSDPGRKAQPVDS